MEKGEALQKLVPLCCMMIKNPSQENAKAIAEMMSQVSPNVLQSLQNGLLGSLINPLLNASVSLESKIYVLQCITELLTQTQVSNANVFWTVHSAALVLIYSDDKNQIIESHEELKLSAIKCISTVLTQANVDVVIEIYTKANVPKFANCAYMCKILVQTEKLSTLRIAAIECIMAIAHVHDEADENDILLRQQIGEVIMFFLPGTVALLRDVILEGETTPHKAKVIALRAWSRIIAIVMEDVNSADDELMEKPVENLEIDWSVKNKEELLERLNASTRSSSWYQRAAEMITKSLKAISIAQIHSHWNVRKELALSCKTLVSMCSRNMEPGAGYLLDILIVLANDDIEAVRASSQDGLMIFAEKLHKHRGRYLLAVVEENFYNVITSLPRVLKGMDEAKQLATLNLLSGYMKLLGKEKLSEVFLSAAHLERFILMLIQAFQLDNIAVQLLDDCSIKEVDSVNHTNINISWKLFKTCHYPEQLTKLVNICKLLGEYVNLNLLSNYLLDIFFNSVGDRKEVTVILNETLASAVHNSHAVQNVLDAYLEPSVWYAPLKTGVSNDESSTTVIYARSNIIQACLLLEGVGKMIKSVGTDCDHLLKEVLFPVLERAGNSHELVALFGLEALCSIAAAAHLKDVACLINANLDYLSNAIQIKMRRNDADISALNVLRVMTKHCTAKNLPRLKDVLERAIKQSYGIYQTTDAILFVEVLHPLMICLRHLKHNTKPIKEDNQTKYFSQCITSGEVVDELLNYHRDIEVAGNFRDEVPVIHQKTEEEKPKERSSLTELTVSVMQRCVHLISTTDRQVTLLVLSILKEGLIALKEQDDDLLPVVHQIWAPLHTRLCDLSDHMIGRHSLQVLLILAETAKSFIRNRTLQKVLPYFCQFLSSNAENSKRKDKGNAYRFTQLYKLQLEMLQGLGSLAVNINLQEREIWQILQASAAYLSLCQPLPFQNACVELYTKLAILNRESVWLKLMDLYCEAQELKPPCEGLPHIHITSKSNKKYEKNVKQILAIIR